MPKRFPTKNDFFLSFRRKKIHGYQNHPNTIISNDINTELFFKKKKKNTKVTSIMWIQHGGNEKKKWENRVERIREGWEHQQKIKRRGGDLKNTNVGSSFKYWRYTHTHIHIHIIPLSPTLCKPHPWARCHNWLHLS